ncbi:hypothetical protein HN873_032252 [Arachis hypogaea]
MDSVTGVGPGYMGPSYDKLRVHLLADLKRECQMLVDNYRSPWREIGCTLMADGWTDQRQRTLINFLVYFFKSLYFVKSVDTSSMVIEWIGLNDIMHVVTDNKYENIYWSPCAPHCLNLILKDISSMTHISNLTSHASKITSIFEHKADLQSFIVDSYFIGHKLGKSINSRAVSAIILDSKFWDDCFTACKLVGHLIKLLRIVDTDDKPSLGYVYEEILRI